MADKRIESHNRIIDSSWSGKTKSVRTGRIGNTEYSALRTEKGVKILGVKKKGNREIVSRNETYGPYSSSGGKTRKDRTITKEGTLPGGTKYKASRRKDTLGHEQTTVRIKQPGRRVELEKTRTKVSGAQQRDGKAREYVWKESIGSQGMRKRIPVKHRTSKGKK